jgi:hypothetical protein
MACNLQEVYHAPEFNQWEEGWLRGGVDRKSAGRKIWGKGQSVQEGGYRLFNNVALALKNAVLSQLDCAVSQCS